MQLILEWKQREPTKQNIKQMVHGTAFLSRLKKYFDFDESTCSWFVKEGIGIVGVDWYEIVTHACLIGIDEIRLNTNKVKHETKNKTT